MSKNEVFYLLIAYVSPQMAKTYFKLTTVGNSICFKVVTGVKPISMQMSPGLHEFLLVFLEESEY